MIAGDDITLGAEDVIRNTRQTLAAYDDGVFGVSEVQAAALASWRDVKNRIAETNVLSPFNLTINEFVQIGRDKFGDPKFTELVQRIEVESLLKCQMLICGFDQNLIPSLLVCDDDHPCSDYTRADFMAIGSGHTAAISSLAFHNYTRERTVAEAVYQVCAAKFMAERSGAAGVGRDTLVLCLDETGRKKWIFKGHIEMIRALWEREGQPRIPPTNQIVDTIEPILKHQKWIREAGPLPPRATKRSPRHAKRGRKRQPPSRA